MCMEDSSSVRTNLCFISWHMRGVLILSVTALAILLASLTATAPLRLWDPIAQEAGRISGEIWLFRLLKLHRVLLLPILLLGPSLLVFELIEFRLSPRWLLEADGVSEAGLLTVLVAMAWWVMPPRAMLLRLVHENVQLGGKHRSPRQADVRRIRILFKHIFSGIFYTRDSGVHYKLRIVIVVSFYVFATPVTYSGLSYFVICWVARVGLLAILLGAQDQPATFEDLQNTGACYGLVADAARMRDILQRHLQGRPVLPHMTPLTYKATISRMDDTLAGIY